MTIPTQNETWLIDAGDQILAKEALGEATLSVWERLVYCLWVADYGMRNAGDLLTAQDMDADFQRVGLESAKELKLMYTAELFSLSYSSFEACYFDLFERVCEEIRNAIKDR